MASANEAVRISLTADHDWISHRQHNQSVGEHLMPDGTTQGKEMSTKHQEEKEEGGGVCLLRIELAS